MIGLRAFQRSTPTLRAQFAGKQQLIQRRWASETTNFQGAADNAFNRERQAVKDHASGTSDLWRKMSIYIVIPCLCIAGVNAWRLWNEHWEHVAHGPSLEEKVEYPYQNIRTKNFFWGDGDKTAFWNPKVNYHKKDE
ncbi:hypothetical protein LTR17_004815 [Elasticomyces elasticus]|nr:hypothetical protein LTR27_008657 [Elasticomyces elasticus]KAK5679267.1 hypothetical protein LTS10_008082 [Elasticomyces elasticus]KAK5732040.1 hypothetical protein LTR17_010876 [Elasticomyces elasticus]KAK5740103.1 hypothetical protein LTR17_004815 [Elasticomyces elasticus]